VKTFVSDSDTLDKNKLNHGTKETEHA